MKAATPPPTTPESEPNKSKGVTWVCVVNFGTTVDSFFNCSRFLRLLSESDNSHWIRLLISKAHLPATLQSILATPKKNANSKQSPRHCFSITKENPLRLQNISCHPLTSGGHRVLEGSRFTKSAARPTAPLCHDIGIPPGQAILFKSGRHFGKLPNS
jgi:hypothetical protein